MNELSTEPHYSLQNTFFSNQPLAFGILLDEFQFQQDKESKMYFECNCHYGGRSLKDQTLN